MSIPAQGAVGAETMTAGIGPRTITTSRQTCAGCPALQTKEWTFYGENDEVDSGTDGKCTAAGKVISGYWSERDPTPDWCPALASPRADSDERTAGDAPWGIEEADGRIWVGPLARDGAKVDAFVFEMDIRDIGSEAQERSRADARRVVNAINATPAQPAEAVPDSLREAFKAADLHECWVNGDTADVMSNPYGHCGNFDQIVARCATGDLWRKRAVAIAESLNFVRTLLASHPAGQSATAEPDPTLTYWIESETERLCNLYPAAAAGIVEFREELVGLMEGNPAGQSAGSGADLTEPHAVFLAMHAGKIAKPTLDRLVQIYGADTLRAHLARLGPETDLATAARSRGEWGLKGGHDTEGTSNLLIGIADRLSSAPDSTRTGQGEETSEVRAIAELLRRHDGTTRIRSRHFDTARAIAAALAARPAAPEAQGAWLPISTAPRNDTLVTLGFWDGTDDPRWIAVSGWYEAGPADQCWYSAYDEERIEPTHWQPLGRLPAPPASSSQGAR